MTDPRLHIRSPEWLEDVNAEVMKNAEGSVVLTVVGRRSGIPRRNPVTLYADNGARYIVGGFPGADWVRNVRATDHAILTIDGHNERISLVEVDSGTAESILRLWPSITPDGVAVMLEAGVVSDTTPDALAAVAGICPVFRVVNSPVEGDEQ